MDAKLAGVPVRLFFCKQGKMAIEIEIPVSYDSPIDLNRGRVYAPILDLYK